jgi:hypothetical protein
LYKAITVLVTVFPRADPEIKPSPLQRRQIVHGLDLKRIEVDRQVVVGI